MPIRRSGVGSERTFTPVRGRYSEDVVEGDRPEARVPPNMTSLAGMAGTTLLLQGRVKAGREASQSVAFQMLAVALREQQETWSAVVMRTTAKKIHSAITALVGSAQSVALMGYVRDNFAEVKGAWCVRHGEWWRDKTICTSESWWGKWGAKLVTTVAFLQGDKEAAATPEPNPTTESYEMTALKRKLGITD